MALDAGQVAQVDQIRAGFTEALATPCECGDCPSDEQMRLLLDLDDETLLTLLVAARQSSEDPE